MLCTVTPRLKGKTKQKQIDKRSTTVTLHLLLPLVKEKNNLFEKPFHNIKAGIMKTLSLIKILAQSWQKSQSWCYQDILHKGTWRDLIGSMTSIFISWHVLSKKMPGSKKPENHAKKTFEPGRYVSARKFLGIHISHAPLRSPWLIPCPLQGTHFVSFVFNFFFRRLGIPRQALGAKYLLKELRPI